MQPTFSPMLLAPGRSSSNEDGNNEERTSSYPKQDLKRPSSSVARERQEFELFCGFVAKAQHPNN